MTKKNDVMRGTAMDMRPSPQAYIENEDQCFFGVLQIGVGMPMTVRHGRYAMNPVLGSLCLVLGLHAGHALAECDLDDVIGYTLVDRKTVDGYIEDGVFHDEYEGCEWGRVLVFTDNTGVQCTTYNYSYAYRPEAYIFVSGSSIKVCIDGDLMDAAPIN